MAKFSDEERKNIEDFISKNMDLASREVSEKLNSQKVSVKEVSIQDVNNIRAKLRSHGKAAVKAKKGRQSPTPEENDDEIKTFTFQGLIDKMQDVIDYAKGLKEKQKKALESSFFL